MNIVLSAKDADFILKYLREDLERVSEAGEKITKKQSEFRDHIKELNVDGPELILANGLIEASDDMINESNEIRNNLTRCIELLTCGSEVTE